MLRGIMRETVELLGTSLVLNKGDLVNLTPATNIPGGWMFADPVDCDEESILLEPEDCEVYDDNDR